MVLFTPKHTNTHLPHCHFVKNKFGNLNVEILVLKNKMSTKKYVYFECKELTKRKKKKIKQNLNQKEINQIS